MYLIQFGLMRLVLFICYTLVKTFYYIDFIIIIQNSKLFKAVQKNWKEQISFF